MRRLYPIAVAALCILCTACSVVRKLPEGSYLVQKVTIEDDRNVPKKERITASELDRYVWQSPNKRFLGTNFYVWVYNQSNPDKDNWWNRFKRKIGEKPVVYDPALTLKSAENLKAYMESHGFFSSRVRYHVDTTSRRKRAIITYRTEQGVMISVTDRSVVTLCAAASMTPGSSVTGSDNTLSTIAWMSLRWFSVRVKSPSA